MGMYLCNKKLWLPWLRELAEASGCQRILVLTGPQKIGPFSLLACLPDSEPCAAELMPLGLACIASRKNILRPTAREIAARKTPRSARVLALPIKTKGEISGAIVAEIAPYSKEKCDAFLTLLQARLPKLLKQHSRLAGTSKDKPAPTADQTRLRPAPMLANTPALASLALDKLVAVCLEHTQLKSAATALVATLAEQLHCDRASLGLSKKHTMHIEALSHSASFDKRSNLLRKVAAAMEESVEQRRVIQYPGDGSSQLFSDQAHRNLTRFSGGHCVLTLPLLHEKQVIGALSLERADDKPFDDATVRQCESAAILIGPVFGLLQLSARSPGEVLFAKLRQWREKLLNTGHYSYKLKFVTCLLAILVLGFAKGEHRVGADALLEGEVQRVMVAPMEGYLSGVHVRPGDRVQSGDTLAELDDRDLRLEQLKWLGQHQQVQSEYSEALAKHDRAQVNILASRLKQSDAQLEMVAEQLRRSHLTAPFDGIVISGDWSQMLGSPVKTGDVLFKVAPLSRYRVILKVDERDISFVAPPQQGTLTLSSTPDQTYTFTVEKITPVSIAKEGRNYFRVESRLETHSDKFQPGMTGFAKVSIAERHLLWIWTHRSVDWLKLHLWA